MSNVIDKTRFRGEGVIYPKTKRVHAVSFPGRARLLRGACQHIKHAFHENFARPHDFTNMLHLPHRRTHLRFLLDAAVSWLPRCWRNISPAFQRDRRGYCIERPYYLEPRVPATRTLFPAIIVEPYALRPWPEKGRLEGNILTPKYDTKIAYSTSIVAKGRLLR